MNKSKTTSIHKRLISSRNEAVMRTMGRHMIPISECAKKNGVSVSRIHKLIDADRIPGAYQTGTGWWLIPAEWVHKRRTGHENRKKKKKTD